MAAAVAVQAQEAIGEDAAVEVGAQFALYEAGNWRVLLACAGEKTFEVLSHDLVEQCLFGLVALVIDGAGPSRGRVQAGPKQVRYRRWGALSYSPR